MKWLSFLAITNSALAFQQVAPLHHYKTKTTLNYFPDKFDRAEQCATHYDTCNLEELEELADELKQFQSSDMGQLQGREDYKDTRRVSEMLRAQSELKHGMKDYVHEHHKETYMSELLANDSAGLGLGLW
mmetsp:Transcript_24661/g.53204  ORF Transcript_24661/g.53204 Transcript_24661/m.53204 type:complete len:130 (-) Transcript_24661:173-562(-)|eukprot:CAMPEP_0172300232 /NCGR_PEP_ID=MMETSP1058-20130122/2358_1 /TAXON_ID=83371 /ORGANISM="Detonula confervacea, Strain CCMP 353" /LENGTH=129 /DNA_ID=CAMNT_0013009947 /DNA_START=80 /DNA_END=469 /DNA_ORIENTATION=+